MNSVYVVAGALSGQTDGYSAVFEIAEVAICVSEAKGTLARLLQS